MKSVTRDKSYFTVINHRRTTAGLQKVQLYLAHIWRSESGDGEADGPARRHLSGSSEGRLGAKITQAKMLHPTASIRKGIFVSQGSGKSRI